MLKRIIFCLLGVWLSVSLGWAQTPDWLQERPMGAFDYIGIGSATKDQSNYQEIAKRNALAELASEIEVTVEANSLLTVMERDMQSVSTFTQMVQTAVS